MSDNNISTLRFRDQASITILSDDIPGPTSYSGRNFIALKLRQDIRFKEKIDDGRDLEGSLSNKLVDSAESINLQQVTEAMKNGFSDEKIFPNLGLSGSTIRLVEKEVNKTLLIEIISAEPISPKLKNLTPREVLQMILQSQRLNVYKAINGVLTYNFIPHDFPSFGKTRRLPPVLLRPENFSVAQSDHLTMDSFNGNANPVVSGTAPTIVVTVRGHADSHFTTLNSDGYRIDFVLPPGQSIRVKFDDDTFQTAKGDSSWQGRLELSRGTPGEIRPVKITAQATYNYHVFSQEEKTGTIDFYSEKILIASFARGGEYEDCEPPIVTITKPRDCEDFPDKGTHVKIEVEGSAEDRGDRASGMNRVEVMLDDTSSISTVSTDSIVPWKSWRAEIDLSHEVTNKDHKITAIAYDNANNSAAVSVTIRVISKENPEITALLLVEHYKLSSFPGDFGLGKTIQMCSLFPGEKTKISVKTFMKTPDTKKLSSSILDSISYESADDFENSILTEQINKQNFQETTNFKIDAHVDSSWGFGSVSLETGSGNETKAAREDFAKNVTNAIRKHLAKASATRNVQIDTSYEVQAVPDEETPIVREIENFNPSSTLNFVFRQLNQIFYSFLHLVDVGVAFYKNDRINPPTYIEETLPFLARLLRRVIQENEISRITIPANSEEKNKKKSEIPNWQIVYNDILVQLDGVIDYDGVVHGDFIIGEPFRDQEGNKLDSLNFVRVNKRKTVTYVDPLLDPAESRPYTLDGIIIGQSKNVLRTDGTIVEAILGQGNALDTYSEGLLTQAIRKKDLYNELKRTKIEKNRLGIKVVKDKDEQSAKIFEQVFPCCKSQLFSCWPPKDEDEK